MYRIKLFWVVAIICIVQSCAKHNTKVVSNNYEQRFLKVIEKVYSENPDSIGIMIHVESPDKSISYSGAVGFSSKQKTTKIEATQPALIASNVKTYTSVAILRLIEQSKITLFQPINGLISDKSNKLLVNDGYDTNTITIAHLLSHTSGIADYIDKAYLEFVQKNQKHRWTRDEQIALSVKIGSPLGKAGDTFSYADVNYLLLTEIIERLTDKPFNQAIGDLIDYKKHQLNSTWFMSLDEVPKHTLPLVHQYSGKYGLDSYVVDPSFDLYGAGGIAATTKDLARFMQLLFTGQIIKDKNVFEFIHTEIHTKDEMFPNYHLGLMSSKLQGLQSYGHGGFWATVVQYLPEINTSVSVYIMEKNKGSLRKNVLEGLVDELKKIYGINYSKTVMPNDISKLWVADGDINSDKVLIISQGGPSDNLKFVTSKKTSYRYIKGYDDYLKIHLHQSNTFNPTMFSFDNSFSIEDAKLETENSAEILNQAIKHFKGKNKKVVVTGHSYGAFIVENHLANYPSQADKYIIISGRLDADLDNVKYNLQGLNGTFENHQFVADNIDDFSQRTQTEQKAYRVKQLLKAAIGQPRYSAKLANIDLTNVVFIYSENDSRVGELNVDEIKFLESKNAQVFKTKHPHGKTIWALADLIKSGKIYL